MSLFPYGWPLRMECGRGKALGSRQAASAALRHWEHAPGAPPGPSYVSRLKMLCDRLVVCGRIVVGHAPFSDSASHPALLGTSGESMSYTAAYRAIPEALVDSSR